MSLDKPPAIYPRNEPESTRDPCHCYFNTWVYLQQNVTIENLVHQEQKGNSEFLLVTGYDESSKSATAPQVIPPAKGHSSNILSHPSTASVLDPLQNVLIG